MSTSLLYHGFGIYGYQYVRTFYRHGAIWFKIKKDRLSLRCPVCNSWKLILRGSISRLFRALPIGKKPVFVECPIQRVECRTCGIIRQVKISFANERRSYTKAFERFALELSKHMTISDVANHLGISWDTIKDIQKRYLKRRFSRPKLNKLSLIAIDEISIGRGHRYLTVVLDLKTGAVVFVGDGRGVASLKPFWRRLNACNACIEAVAMDMSPAYISAVKENLPDDYLPLLENEATKDLIRMEIESLSRGIRGFEKIKKFALISEEFTTDNGLLTPTLKLKRRKVMERYGDIIDSMYLKSQKKAKKR